MVHQFKLRGLNIVLDVASGAVHSLDDLSYRMLAMLTPPLNKECPNEILRAFDCENRQEVMECYDEIFSLYKDGVLFSDDMYQKYADLITLSPIKSMCLNVAHDCNLRCAYCFASTGDFGEGRKLMTEETGKRAIDFLLTHSGSRHNLELDFFGGEPLMNFDVVRAVVHYARSQEKAYNKNFRFTITTNGLLLDDEKIDFINREMSNVVLSLDGRSRVHDKMRPTANGTGSYDLVIEKFKKLVQTRGDKDYYARGTFTKHNLDFSEDVLSLYEQGFSNLSIEPVISDGDKEYAITQEDLPRIFEEYEQLADALLEKKLNGEDISFFHFIIDLDQGPCAIKRLRGCSCGNEYVAVTPDGDIFPCHQFVGKENWKIGNLYDPVLDQSKREPFCRTTIYDKEECNRCWAKFYCSGGCNANNFQFEGDILRPYTIACELEKKRLECAIMLQAALKEEEKVVS